MISLYLNSLSVIIIMARTSFSRAKVFTEIIIHAHDRPKMYNVQEIVAVSLVVTLTDVFFYAIKNNIA